MYDYGGEFRILVGSTGIEYDPAKDEINRKKHKYSLESAAFILEREILPFNITSSKKSVLFTRDATNNNSERRFEHLTEDDEKNVVFIVTTMRPNESVRVISFRAANPKERQTFYDLCREIIAELSESESE